MNFTWNPYLITLKQTKNKQAKFLQWVISLKDFYFMPFWGSTCVICSILSSQLGHLVKITEND